MLFSLAYIDLGSKYVTEFHAGKAPKSIQINSLRNISLNHFGVYHKCFLSDINHHPYLENVDDAVSLLYSEYKGKISTHYLEIIKDSYNISHFEYVSYSDMNKTNISIIAKYNNEDFVLNGKYLETEWENDGNNHIKLQYTCDPEISKAGAITEFSHRDNTNNYTFAFSTPLLCNFPSLMNVTYKTFHCYNNDLLEQEL